MIGYLPRYTQSILDYRYALDAAMVSLYRFDAVLVRCHKASLQAEVSQRLLAKEGRNGGMAGLWIEPLVATWEKDLQEFQSSLSRGSLLVIIASRPLARLLPVADHTTPSMGMTVGGMRRLRQGLQKADFCVESCYGVHTLNSIVWNQAGLWASRWHRPDIGDRLQFAARLRYHATGRSAFLSTLALLFAYKGEGACRR